MNQNEAAQALEVLEQDMDNFKGIKDQKKKLELAMQELASQLGDQMQNFEESIESNSEVAKKILLSCEEMKKDSLPDYTADYWEERHSIDSNIDLLQSEIVKL